MRASLGLCVLLAFPAFAQVKVEIALPTITFTAPPPLVVVEPGVQVVEDYDDEIFFVDGFYWVRRDGRWFHTRQHTGGWIVVDGPRVPPMLIKAPPGRYRRWKKGKGKATTVVVNPPGPGKVKIKVKGGKKNR